MTVADETALSSRQRRRRMRLGVGLYPLPAYIEWQLGWYDNRKRAANAGYVLTECVSLVSALLIPLATAAHWAPGRIGALGASAAAASGIGLIFRFKHNYIACSTTLEHIRATVAKYLAMPPERRDSARLVREVSRIVLAENSEWEQAMVMADGSDIPHTGAAN
jgi:hypothetical protein